MKNYIPVFASFLSLTAESVWVACGGVLGALARYGIDKLLLPSHVLHLGFPWPTFIINVSGSALLGFILAWVEEGDRPPHWLRPFVGIGFCGAFTTFSTASVEILLLARDGHPWLGVAYVGASLVSALLAVTLTTAIAVRLFKNPNRTKGKAAA